VFEGSVRADNARHGGEIDRAHDAIETLSRSARDAPDSVIRGVTEHLEFIDQVRGWDETTNCSWLLTAS